MRRARLRGLSEPSAQERGSWHRDRAKAQLERIERVLECGATVFEARCPSCEKKHEISGGLRSARIQRVVYASAPL